MNEQEEKKRNLYITHSLELLFWLVVVLIIVAFSSLSFIHKEKNRENDYRVFLPDVDGLIVGSSVRMLGIEVGHVVKIKPLNNEVYVKFIITNPDVYIPQGTQVTVEFSGMAGSKSLELYPPTDKTYVGKDTPVMLVNPPKRLHDALELFDVIYKKLGSIIYTGSSFGKKISEEDLSIGTQSGQVQDAREFINYADKFLDESNKKAYDIRKSIEGLRKNAEQIQKFKGN